MRNGSSAASRSPDVQRAPGPQRSPHAPGELGPRSPVPRTAAAAKEADAAHERRPPGRARAGPAIRVLLAEGRVLLRQALRSLLEREGIEIVAEVTEGRRAVQLARRFEPDLALLGIDLPRLHGLAVSKQLLRVSPRTRTIVLSVDGERRFARDAIAAGARGFLLWDQPAGELLLAIREVHRGHLYFGSRAEPGVREARSFASASLAGLSRRQTEVVDLVAEGLSLAAIGGLLGISARTAASHRNVGMRKLRAAAARRAVEAAQLRLVDR